MVYAQHAHADERVFDLSRARPPRGAVPELCSRGLPESPREYVWGAAIRYVGGGRVSADAKSHAWRIEDREYARHEARRGRRFAFSRLVPARTALVVIDMVPFFVAGNAYCRGIVPKISRGGRDVPHLGWHGAVGGPSLAGLHDPRRRSAGGEVRAQRLLSRPLRATGDVGAPRDRH